MGMQRVRKLLAQARPPIAQDRLERLEDGRVGYRFKRAWKDGSTTVDLKPFDLLVWAIARSLVAIMKVWVRWPLECRLQRALEELRGR